MRIKKKIRVGFLGCVHAFITGLPLLMIIIMIVINVLNGFSAANVDGVASQSLNYSNTLDMNSVFAYYNTNLQFTFGLIDINFLDMIGVTNSDVMTFVNWYLNYLINVELMLFLPEVLLMFIGMCRNLIYKFTNKLSEEDSY